MRRSTLVTPSEAERMPTGACQREGGIEQERCEVGGIDEFERIWLVYEPAEAIYRRTMEILEAAEPITMIKTTDRTGEP